MRDAEFRGSVAGRLQSGFSMLEILVTLIILALGLLGTAALQAQSMRTAQGGQYRSQAVLLAADIGERMEANKTGATEGAYVLSAGETTNSTRDCAGEPCNADDLALFDLETWQNNVSDALPGASWEIVRTVAGNPSIYSIAVTWVDRRSDTTYETAGIGETFSYTTVKAVYN